MMSENYKDMTEKTQKALILNNYDGNLVHQETAVPSLEQGELLVKVQASTVNPSDRLFITGAYFKKPLPTIAGFEGVGTVVEAKGQGVQSWVGKRVSFTSQKGTWSQYSITSPFTAFEIDEDVPTGSAASGVVNPLTVIGFIENYKTHGLKGGIVHTAAASALGRQLNKYAQREKIPLLNVVRREEQAEILRKEGAEYVLVTSGENWQEELKDYIQNKGFNTIYDALGGGPTSDFIVSNLPPKSFYFLYGMLEAKPLTITNTTVFFTNVTVTGFSLFNWWPTVSKEDQQKIRKEYSSLLKNELSTKTLKQYGFDSISEAIEVSKNNSTEGKVLLRP